MFDKRQSLAYANCLFFVQMRKKTEQVQLLVFNANPFPLIPPATCSIAPGSVSHAYVLSLYLLECIE